MTVAEVDMRAIAVLGLLALAASATGSSQAEPSYLKLRTAVFRHDASAVVQLLREGVSQEDLNVILLLAAERGDPSIARILLDAGADPNNGPGSPQQETPLQKAAFAGHGHLIRLLLDRGAAPNVRCGADQGSSTPVHEAVAFQHPVAVAELIRAGADVDARAGYNARREPRTVNDGATPLMVAAAAGDLLSIQVLLKAGADVTLKDDAGKTALDWLSEFEKNLSGVRKQLEVQRRH
jgi:ankyrin repeat protein